MADLKIKFPWPVVSDPTATALLLLHDNGDGTHSPVVSGTAPIAANVATDGSVGDLVTALIAAGLMEPA